MKGHTKHVARPYIIGYIASLVLTALAFGMALAHSLTTGPLMTMLLILGAVANRRPAVLLHARNRK